MNLELTGYQAHAERLKDRVILITGAGDGLGRALATGAAAQGATVILLGRTLHKLEQVYDAIETAGCPQPAIYPMNLEGAVAQDYQELADRLETEFGHLDGLVHCAAELPLLSRIDDYELRLWFKVMQVDLHAPFVLTQFCLPLLRHSADASVVFVSDRAGRQGKAYWGAYGVAKAGIENLMQILADENENRPIRFNTLDPGPMRTALRARVYPAEDPTQLPLPIELIDPLLWLLGPESAAVSGQSLDVRDPS